MVFGISVLSAKDQLSTRQQRKIMKKSGSNILVFLLQRAVGETDCQTCT